MPPDPKRNEFFFEDLVVGYFEDRFPTSAGRYPYMPFRGLGHFKLVEALASSGPQRCDYLFDGEKRYFTVERIPSIHVLEVSGQ